MDLAEAIVFPAINRNSRRGPAVFEGSTLQVLDWLSDRKLADYEIYLQDLQRYFSAEQFLQIIKDRQSHKGFEKFEVFVMLIVGFPDEEIVENPEFRATLLAEVLDRLKDKPGAVLEGFKFRKRKFGKEIIAHGYISQRKRNQT